MNRYSSTKDTTMQRKATGGGCSFLFQCMRCGNKRSQQGRRLRHVRGLRTWVCAGCAK